MSWRDRFARGDRLERRVLFFNSIQVKIHQNNSNSRPNNGCCMAFIKTQFLSFYLDLSVVFSIPLPK
ncbi:hypothetical protein [Calothrix sp. NIES-2100]|uniref:hypothetical protein n=1 Tax=Calothrix sp. NIES-2100 TaxID=1954172 RepID=UPI0030DD9947